MLLKNHYVAQALEKIPDKNLLINVAAKRAAEICRGSKPLVEFEKLDKPLEIALLEIAQEKVKYSQD